MAEKGNLFSPGFSSRCAVSPVIAGEGVFILHSFLLGVIITFIYDLFRIVRRIIPPWMVPAFAGGSGLLDTGNGRYFLYALL